MYFEPDNRLHAPGRIRKVRSTIPGVWHWGVEGWDRGADGHPRIWHAQKNGVLRCTSYGEFSNRAASEIVWTPQTYAQRVSVIQRLESIEGLRWNLFNANCEQIVRWAVEGRPYSGQLVAGVAVFCLVGAVALISSKQTW